jgi:hypothetical protein
MLKEERGDRSHAHNRVVLLTDGISSVGGHPTIRKQKDLLEAQSLKDTGAVLICVGITNPDPVLTNIQDSDCIV